ncbi:MAG TPA: sugar ABC transporter permease [Trebonia sp.]|jgi:ABC-type sugar transport system permease subunit
MRKARTASFRQRERRAYWLFVLPAVLLICAFKVYPVIRGIGYSFTTWPGFGPSKFVGLRNYRLLLTDGSFETVLLNNLKLVIAIPFFVVVPLIVAVILFERPWGHRFLRAAYFFPAILSPVIVGVMFEELLTASGPVDDFIRFFDPGFGVTWLGSPSLALWTVLAVVLWASFGIGVLVFLSALSTVPLEMFDAAKIDGAGWWATFRYVTAPALRKVISFWTVILTITLFTSLFGYIFSLTSGGPGVDSTVLEYDVYLEAFTNGDFGYASAVAVVLMVITGIIVAIQLRLTLGRKQ